MSPSGRPLRAFVSVFAVIAAAITVSIGELPARIAYVRALIDSGQYVEGHREARRLVTAAGDEGRTGSLSHARALDLLVETMWRLGEACSPEASEAAERALEIKEGHLDGSDPALVPSLTNLGVVLLEGPDPGRAADVLERSRELAEGVHGSEHRAVARILIALAAAKKETSDHDAARALYERVLAMKGTVFDEHDPDLALAYHGLGSLEFLTGDYEACTRSHRVSLEIRERAFGPHHVAVAESLVALGRAHKAQARHDRAGELYDRALRIQKESLGDAHPQVAITLNNIGDLRFTMGDYQGSRIAYEHALSIAERALGRRHRFVGTITRSVAKASRIFGEFGRAEAFYRRSLAIDTAVKGENHPELIYSLMGLGWSLFQQGDYLEARRVYERALTIGEDGLGPDHPSVASVRMHFATLSQRIGDCELAEALNRRNLAAFENSYGEQHPQIARTLIGLGNIRLEQERYQEARAFFERALAMAKATLPENHGTTLGILHNIGVVLSKQGHHGQAKAIFEQRLAVQETRWPDGNPSMISALAGVSRERRLLGDFAGAQNAAERARSLNERYYGKDHPMTAEGRMLLGRLCAARGEWSRAIELALDIEATSRVHLRLVSAGLPERQALSYAAERPRGLDLALASLSRAEESAPHQRAAALDALIRSRAVVLDEMARRHGAATRTADRATRELAEELAAARSRLARLVARGLAGAPPDSYRSMLARAKASKETLESRLAETSAEFASARKDALVGLEAVRETLPRRSALASFARYEDEDLGAGYLAFVLRAEDEAPHVVALGDAERVEGAVRVWREAVTSRPEGLAGAQRKALIRYMRAGQALRRLIWDPLEASLGEAREVFVVPAGALHLVSFVALPQDDGFLIEDSRLVRRVSVERDLTRRAHARQKGEGLLALGAPDFDAASEHRSQALTQALARKRVEVVAVAATDDEIYRGPAPGCRQALRAAYAPLPQAGLEVAEIVALVPEGTAALPSLSLTGAAASERAFKRLAPGRRGLHLATHGFFVPEDCDPWGVGPLLRSGMVLAGVHRRAEAPAGEEDGVLTSEEIASLDLGTVEWAVLSGCGTGLGTLQPGEGVLGLQRAFRIAGAGSLVMSLWEVEDRATRDWMARFYEVRLSGTETFAAARAASLGTLRARREAVKPVHPFYWAAFVTDGAGR